MMVQPLTINTIIILAKKKLLFRFHLEKQDRTGRCSEFEQSVDNMREMFWNLRGQF